MIDKVKVGILERNDTELDGVEEFRLSGDSIRVEYDVDESINSYVRNMGWLPWHNIVENNEVIVDENRQMYVVGCLKIDGHLKIDGQLVVG